MAPVHSDPPPCPRQAPSSSGSPTWSRGRSRTRPLPHSLTHTTHSVLTDLVKGQIEDTARVRGIPRESVVNDVLLADQPTKQFVDPKV